MAETPEQEITIDQALASAAYWERQAQLHICYACGEPAAPSLDAELRAGITHSLKAVLRAARAYADYTIQDPALVQFEIVLRRPILAVIGHAS